MGTRPWPLWTQTSRTPETEVDKNRLDVGKLKHDASRKREAEKMGLETVYFKFFMRLWRIVINWKKKEKFLWIITGG